MGRNPKTHQMPNNPYRRKNLKPTCEACGFIPDHPRQLEVHHMDEDRSNNAPDNLTTLCANCHALIHANPDEIDDDKEWKVAMKTLMRITRERTARRKSGFWSQDGSWALPDGIHLDQT